MDIFIFSILVTCYYTIHSLLANYVVKAFLINMFAPKRYYRIFYNVVAIILLLPIVYWYKIGDKTILLVHDWWLKLPGMVLLSIGLVLNLRAIRQYDISEFIGTAYLKERKLSGGERLNTSGLNLWVRHPLYLAALLVFWGLFFILWNDFTLALAIISHVYILIGIELEEKKLMITFGEAYQKYRGEVPKLWSFKLLFSEKQNISE